MFAVAMIGVSGLGLLFPQATIADFNNVNYTAVKTVQQAAVVKTIPMLITAYASVPDETDDTPFTTASGKMVAVGIVANNMLPFGTKVMIPELYGNQVFVVEDRMAKRMGSYHMDIWMPTKTSAVVFGAKTATIEVLEN